MPSGAGVIELVSALRDIGLYTMSVISGIAPRIYCDRSSDENRQAGN
ncbi:hypothetical protein AGR2A_pa60167 [Agrobacterium genomosp. 2 str. CFBP 5494]|uniref:Uncharacterized protein n=1 Tax=Agrobacterium genomosp. 2 str. CFBP 5494 TaxID=1183436 RepID=A0A9W5F3M2_9HYPH|nr:hypothetical protein AGR2A_pa60167 [Agrobacterium genomosp. 2 str. CFBP 5494]